LSELLKVSTHAENFVLNYAEQENTVCVSRRTLFGIRREKPILRREYWLEYAERTLFGIRENTALVGIRKETCITQRTLFELRREIET